MDLLTVRSFFPQNGDYEIDVVAGGTFTDSWTALRNLQYDGFGTADIDAAQVVDSDGGEIRIPVHVTGTRTSTFSVDWAASDGTSGTLVWNAASEGVKWIVLPLGGRETGFSVALTDGRGVNVSGSANRTVVTVYTSAVPRAVCAESGDSAAVRLECRAEGSLGRALVSGREFVSPDGETRSVEWDSSTVADGWRPNGILVRNSDAIAVEGGRGIAAGKSGKIKTASTMIGLCVMMAFPTVSLLAGIVVGVTVVTTVYSGVEYFIQNWNCLWD